MLSFWMLKQVMNALLESPARGWLLRKNNSTARVGHEIHHLKGNRKGAFRLINTQPSRKRTWRAKKKKKKRSICPFGR